MGNRPVTRTRMAPVRIPTELLDEFLTVREDRGETHTQAIERAIRMYVRSKRKTA